MPKNVHAAHLSWIRPPIIKSVEIAKASIDTYFKKHADLQNPPQGAQAEWFANQKKAMADAFRNVSEHVELIHSALTVCDSPGGSALSVEMRVVCTSVQEKLLEEEKVAPAILAMMSGMIMLPNYLKMVIDGAPDAPGILSRQINEIREVRGVPLLVEDSLPPSMLSFEFVDPPRKIHNVDDARQQEVFSTSSRRFQTAFSSYIGTQSKGALADMRQVLRELQEVSHKPEVGDFWWVGECLLEALAVGGLRSGGNTVSQVRMLSVAVQKIGLGGEEAALEVLGIDRFKSLLYVLSLSSKSTPSIEAALRVFNVGKSVDTDSLAKLQRKLESTEATTIADVVLELKPLLDAAMVSLGRALGARSDDIFSVQLSAYSAAMRSVANVFYMVGEDELAGVANKSIALVAGKEGISGIAAEVVDDLKSYILYLDERINLINENDATKALNIEGVGADVLDTLVSECLIEVVKTRRSVSVHVESGIGQDELKDGLASLVNTAAALKFSGAEQVGDLLGAVCSGMVGLLDNAELTYSPELDLLAKALVAIEMYLEAIKSKLEPDPENLTKAAEALRELGIDFTEVAPVTTNELLIKFEAAQEEVREDDDPFLTELFELRSVFEDSFTSLDLRSRSSIEQLYKAADRLSMAARMHGHESFGKIASGVAAFSKGVTNRALKEDFDHAEEHDLLRSGVEMCLRCMDEYSLRNKVSLFVKDVADALMAKADPEMQLAYTSHPEIPASSTNATHQPAVQNKLEQVVAEPDAVILAHEQEREMPEGVDPVLIDIFRQEFTEQYAAMSAYLKSGRKDVNEAFCRVAHTLHGISSSADCLPLASAFAALETRLFQLRSEEAELLQGDVEALLDFLADAERFQQAFPWKTETPALHSWLEVVQALGCGAEEAEYVEVAQVTPVSHAKPEPDAPQESHQPENLNPVSHAKPGNSESGDVQESTTKHAQQPSAPPAIEYNPEMAEFYIEEAEEVLPQLQLNVDRWMGQMDDHDLVTTIKRQMHTLKGAAAMAEAASIREITHYMESLFESLSLSIIPASDDCARLVEYVLVALDQMTSAMRRAVGYEVPSALIRCVEAAVQHNRVDLGLLAQEPCTAGEVLLQDIQLEKVATQDARAETLEACEAQSIAELEEETPKTEEFEQGIVHPQGEENSLAEEESGHKKTRRRSRGKGGAKRHAARMAAHAQPAQEDSLVVSSEPEDSVEVESPALPAVPEATPEESGKSVPAPVAIPELVEVPPSISAVTAQEQEVHHEPERQSRTLRESVEGITSKSAPTKPVSSSVIREILAKAHDSIHGVGSKRRSGGSEKIKVDQRLLDTAVEQSSELTAARYRQQALHAELMMIVTIIREKLEAQQLNHMKFTSALRLHTNQPVPTALAHQSAGDFQLERFNDLSALNVTMGAQLAQTIQDVEEMFAQGKLIKDSYRQQAGLISSLQRDLLDSRLVPFQNIRPALTNLIERESSKLGKKVDTVFTGGDVIVDKVMLDAVRDPLVHLLNNALDHGIEPEAQRIAQGKSAHGSLEVNVCRRAKNIVITVKDDGKGIDTAMIKAKALEKGIIRQDDQLTESDLLRLITHNGFSTAAKVSQLSGRGVGMDIVATTVESMGGRLVIESKVGWGTTFTLEMPFTIGSNRALICRTGSQWFAIPSYTMYQIIQCTRADLEKQRLEKGKAVLHHEGKSFEVVHLADLLAMPEMRSTHDLDQEVLVILCQQGEMAIGIEVDSTDSMPEIHIRKLDGILSKVRGIIGETEMQDGSPVFVIDVMELVRLNLKRTDTGFKVRQNRVKSVKRDLKPVCLVVDDATSYRKLLQKHFEARGYTVITARDGQDAMDMLPLERLPEIVMVDMEMPRMTGLELTKALRARAEFNEVPIIMLTTRTNLEDEALRAGVNVYLNKPCDSIALDNAIAEVRPEQALQGSAA
ncbi:response regulator [Pseudomonas aeruginosa]|uniref:response regulator n=1 Tax=Pseudomonas aeruginosa TaxID=287 RepID=UPI0032B5BFB4